MIIPHTSVQPATLRAVIEEFVSREGTDYGFESSFESKVASVMRQLERGTACLVFDTTSETCDIVVVGSARYRQMVGEG